LPVPVPVNIRTKFRCQFSLAKEEYFRNPRRRIMRRIHMDRNRPLWARDQRQKGRTMLLTNTINARIIDTAIATGIVNRGVALRGCSVCPEHLAERPSEKPASKRIRFMRLAGRGLRAMYSGEVLSWQQSWHESSTSHRNAPSLLLGLVAGRSLS